MISSETPLLVDYKLINSYIFDKIVTFQFVKGDHEGSLTDPNLTGSLNLDLPSKVKPAKYPWELFFVA